MKKNIISIFASVHFNFLKSFLRTISINLAQKKMQHKTPLHVLGARVVPNQNTIMFLLCVTNPVTDLDMHLTQSHNINVNKVSYRHQRDSASIFVWVKRFEKQTSQSSRSNSVDVRRAQRNFEASGPCSLELSRGAWLVPQKHAPPHAVGYVPNLVVLGQTVRAQIGSSRQTGDKVTHRQHSCRSINQSSIIFYLPT